MKIRIILLSLLLSTSAFAQTQPSVRQSGSITSGHMATWSANQVIQDGGSPATGTVTTTGSPANGNLSKFSGATSITNTDLTGDITTSGGVATTLATVNSNIGSFTNANITVNGKGLVTAASSGGASGITLGTSTSAANPQISGDATSGFYTPGAAQVAVTISNTQRTLWTTTGQQITGTLIVTSSSASAASFGANGSTNPVLSIDASTGSVVTGILIKGGATGTSTQISATDSGSNTNIGLLPKGTGSIIVVPTGTTPTQIAPDFGTPRIQVESTGADAGFGVFRFNTGSSSPAKTGIGHSCNATIGSFSSCAAGTQLGQFWFEGVGTSGVFVESSLIEGDVDPQGTPGSSISPGALLFKTANNSGTLNEWFRINYTGNIGIGSTTPRAKLDISQSTDSIILPIGTTGTRPTGINGMIRYNTDSNAQIEGYINNSWQQVMSTTSQAATNTTLTTAISQGAAGYFLPFSDTSALSTGQIITGTSVPNNTVINYIANGSSVKSTTANGGGSGYNVVVTSATGIVKGMIITDTTVGAHIANQCVVNFINGTTITASCSLASVLTTEGLNFYPTVKMSQISSGTIASSTSISFTNNSANHTLTNLTVNGDITMGGKLISNGNTVLQTSISTINGDPSIPVTSISSVALGIGALAAQAAEGGNTALGAYALNSMTGQQGFYQESSFALLGNGSFNTAIGLGAMLNANPSSPTASSGAGSFNTVVGAFSGLAITNGNRNTALGEANQQGTTTGNFNTTVGSENTNIGSLGAGSGNTSVGADATQYLAGSTNNTAMGYLSLQNATSSSYNAAFGAQAMQNMLGASSSDYNAAFGTFAMAGSGTPANNTGIQNAAFGTASMIALTSGSNNVGLGQETLKVLTTGSNNVAVGPAVAQTTLTTGSNNIMIGVSNACTSSGAAASNEFHLCGTAGDSLLATGMGTLATEAWTLRGTMTLTDLGTDATHTDRSVCQDTTSKTLFFGSGAAGICLGTSSIRYKHDVTNIVEGLAQIDSLRPVNFYYKKGFGDDGENRQYGFIAEEMAKSMPGVVRPDKNGKPNSIDYVAIIPILVKAVQELHEENLHLKAVNSNPCNAFSKFGQFIMGCQ